MMEHLTEDIRMFYDNGSVDYELDQWELDECSKVFDLDDEYLSFTTEQELD